MLLVTDWFDLDPSGRRVLCFLYLGLLKRSHISQTKQAI